jgi:type I restriction enzyme M protein
MTIDVVTATTQRDARALVNRLWNFCNLLRDDGVSVLDYVEQLTYLVFLKMVNELKNRKLNAVDIIPDFDPWGKLLDADGIALETTYAEILHELGTRKGVLGQIFRKSQNRIQDPAKLKRLIVELIGAENWSGTGVDIKGDAYESLLERGAEDRKTGAGQYFTPRALIRAMVDCTQPSPVDTVMDPACGTGGFLLAAYEYISEHHGSSLTLEEREKLVTGGIRGTELVDGTARLAAMNMLLHGIVRPDEAISPIEVGDSLAKASPHHASLVLANPPFGVKSTFASTTENDRGKKGQLAHSRFDFWVATSNKQLNFVQHIYTLLETNGRAAVVLPDNVLFEGGAGESLRRQLLKQCALHTLLRLPSGIFYANGVKANVLFFEKPPPNPSGQPATTTLWVYDFRTNQHFTQKQNQLRREDLDGFVDAYKPGQSRAKRERSPEFKPYTVEELLQRPGVNLDLYADLKDDSLDDMDGLLEPHVIAQEVIDELEAALVDFSALAEALRQRVGIDLATEDEPDSLA